MCHSFNYFIHNSPCFNCVNPGLTPLLVVFFYSFNPSFSQSGSTVYVSPPAFLVLWSITSGGHSLAEGFFLRTLKEQLCQRMRSPCWTCTCSSRIPLQQETQQDGEQEETQKGQQKDEPQLRVNWSPRPTDVLFVSVVGLRRSCRQIQNHTQGSGIRCDIGYQSPHQSGNVCYLCLRQGCIWQ